MAYLTLRKVRVVTEADDGAINLTLFRGETGRVCGWFLGPVALSADGLELRYLPRSEQALVSVAISRAVALGRRANAPVCIIDPDNLWDPAWAF